MVFADIPEITGKDLGVFGTKKTLWGVGAVADEQTARVEYFRLIKIYQAILAS